MNAKCTTCQESGSPAIAIYGESCCRKTGSAIPCGRIMNSRWNIMESEGGRTSADGEGKMKKGANICYYGNGRSHWIRREWKPQCSEKVFFYGRCQGVKGHQGVHWCYSPSRSFQWSDNDDDPNHDGAAGSTPPGDKSYVAPVKMAT